jgi:hypothetical protein
LDLKSLALPQNFVESAGVKKLIATVPVRKPNPQAFIRTHPAPEFRRNLLMVNLKDEREFYVVVPALANALAGETVIRMVVTAITRQGVTFLWPLPLPGPDGKDNPWWRSGREAASLAQDHWIRLKANMSLGAYEIIQAPGIDVKPEWPELSFQDLVRIAFKDLVVDKIDHPVIRRLRGLD